MFNLDFEAVTPCFPDRVVYINNYGARPNTFLIEDARNNMNCINRAISYVSEKGGGVVVVPAGIWYTAPITLKSYVNLKLEPNAILKFCKDKEFYPLIQTNYEGQECIRTISPITGENLYNVAITGKGVIDGSGDLWRPVKQFKVTDRQWNALLKKSEFVLDTGEGGIWMPTETIIKGNQENIKLKDSEDALIRASEYYDYYRPVMISFKHCKRVLLDGVTFTNSPAWCIHPFFCEDLTVSNVRISNPYHAQNGDGIDVESCNRVHIHHCVFETGDDGICLKSGKNAEARTIEGPCENVYIHDCIVNKGHGGFVIGSEMSRGVKNVYVTDCTFLGTDVGIRLKSAMGRGGVVENINVSNINMIDIKEQAIILTMSYVLNSLNRNEENKKSDESDIPYFRNITFEGINCMGAGEALVVEPIAGITDTIKDISIINSRFLAANENRIGNDSVSTKDTEFIVKK